MTYVPPLRPELGPAAREKLERIGQQLNRSPSDVLTRLVECIDEIEIIEAITIKLHPEPGSPAEEKGRRRIVIKRSDKFRGW